MIVFRDAGYVRVNSAKPCIVSCATTYCIKREWRSREHAAVVPQQLIAHSFGVLKYCVSAVPFSAGPPVQCGENSLVSDLVVLVQLFLPS